MRPPTEARFACADACKTCHDVCSTEISRLMDATEPSELDDVAIEALIQCAGLCQTASRILRGHEGFVDAIRLTCAINCERVVKTLEPYEQLRDCVEAARTCAECCRALDD